MVAKFCSAGITSKPRCRKFRRSIFARRSSAWSQVRPFEEGPRRFPHRSCASKQCFRYRVTDFGLRAALFFTRAYSRLLRPASAAALPGLGTVANSLKRALDEVDAQTTKWINPSLASEPSGLQFIGCEGLLLDIGRLEVQQAIQLAVKTAPMRCDRAVGEIGPPVAYRAGILQERLELRCEDRVAVIDRVLRITDQMGEAELVRLGVCALRRQAIRQPHLRPHAGEKVRRHALAALNLTGYLTSPSLEEQLTSDWQYRPAVDLREAVNCGRRAPAISPKKLHYFEIQPSGELFPKSY